MLSRALASGVGRLTSGLDLDFVYDPNNRLAAAKFFTRGVEHYLYTADGDLAGVFDINGELTVRLGRHADGPERP